MQKADGVRLLTFIFLFETLARGFALHQIIFLDQNILAHFHFLMIFPHASSLYI